MAGPWEKYDEPAVAGPWEKHAAPPKTAPVKLVNKDIKAGKEAPGWQQGLASVMQGPLLGFADEIGGLVGGTYDTLTQPSLKLSDLITGNRPKTFRENYEANRDTLRGMQQAQEEANPIFTMVTQGMGGMALAPFSGARAATGVIQGGMQAAKTGATTGAISGLGNSTATDIGGMAADTGLGATIGGVGGGVIQMGAAGGGGLVRNVAQRYSPGAADRAAHAKITEQLIRDSSIPDSALTQAEARLRRLGPEARIADTGGQNTKALLDTLATLPGRTKQVVETAIHDRQAGRAGRLMGAADAALGTKGQRMSATLEQLTEARSRNAAPFYAAIKGVDATLDNDMVTLLSRAKGVDKEALADFRLKTGIELPSLANMKAGETLPFEVLDTLKQTLYDSAQAAKRAGANGRGMLFDDLRVSLTNKLDDLSPKIGTQSAYKMARDEFAGKSQLIDAAEVGRKAMRGELFSVQESMKGMSKSETEAFRIGALEALREKTGKEAGQTELLKMWKEPATQDRLKLLFGNDYRQFAAAVASEARLKGLEGVGRGSQTASRLYGAGDLDISPLANVANVATSAKTGNLAGVLSGGVNLMRSIATPEPVRDRMGALLLSRNPQTLRDMGFLLPQINAARARAATASGLLGGQASDGVIGSGLFGN